LIVGNNAIMKIIKIKRISKLASDSKRYDIETKNTHNFFADGILVHNSCINLYYDWIKEEWFAATTGMAEGEGEINNRENTSFNDLFWETVRNKYDEDKFKDNLEIGFTYVFELTTPYNIVVAPHTESRVTLLTIRSLRNLKELASSICFAEAYGLGVPIVEEYDLNSGNVEFLLRTFENMDAFSEGYVVVDDKFNRIKIKNPKYVAIHHLKSKTSSYAIMEIIKSNEVDEFIATFPEREVEIKALRVSYNNLIVELEALWGILEVHKPKNITPAERKKFATKVFEVVDVNDKKTFTGLYFGLMDGKVTSIVDYIRNMDNKRLFALLT